MEPMINVVRFLCVLQEDPKTVRRISHDVYTQKSRTNMNLRKNFGEDFNDKLVVEHRLQEQAKRKTPRKAKN